MTLVWVTGVSATGKTTLCSTLRGRGLDAHDADDGFCEWVDTRTGAVLEGLPESGWADHHDWVISPERVGALARASTATTTYLCGSVSNEAEVWDLFDVVVALIADDDTIAARLDARTSNSFGKSPAQREAVLRWNRDSAELYTRFGAVIVDARQTPEEVADLVVAAVR